MFETTAFKGSWNQEEQTEEGVCGGGRRGWGRGVENRQPKGWEEVGVLPVVSSTQKKQKAFSFSNSKTKTQNVLNMMTLVKIWCLKEVFL